MNRNYRPGGGFGGFSFFPPVIKWLLGLNVGLFLLDALFGSMRLDGAYIGEYLLRWGALFPVYTPYFFPTQLFTYMFMHAGFSHLLFNMLALWMFGMQLEQQWGSKKFLTYYVLCGLGGGIAHLIISPLLGDASYAPLVGASGAVFGLLIAFGLLYPEQHIYIYFLFPIKAKFFVAGYIALEVFLLMQSPGDGISHLAHLGGGVVGIVYLLISVGMPTILGNLRGRRSPSSMWNNARSGGSVFTRRRDDDDTIDADYYDVTGTTTAPPQKKTDARGMRIITQADIDVILDKIAASGYASLTQEERDILFEASRKMDERNR